MLFIPGNAGSYKQVRPIAAEAANFYYQELQDDGISMESGVRNLDFFTVDFNEDITAFHGQTLLDQAEYLNEAVRYILSLYTEPHRSLRDAFLPDPTSVIVLGHSMGGVVARTMLVQPNYQANSINTIITMSTPHARPAVTFDSQIVHLYDQINEYWRNAYSQKWANNNPLWHVTLVSISGGNLDSIVPSDYASLESLVPETHGFTVYTTGIPTVWTAMDHQAILWCDQFRKVVTRALFDIVDVRRASQTKPRADRMRFFKQSMLPGLEATSEKPSSWDDSKILLEIDDYSTTVVPSGKPLVLRSSEQPSKAKAHLLPISPQESPESRRFTLLTDEKLEHKQQEPAFMVLLCSVASSQAATAYSMTIDLVHEVKGSTKLMCKNAAEDVILLPASVPTSREPVSPDKGHGSPTFSYLQYNLAELSDYDFISIVTRPSVVSNSRGFAVAEFSEETLYRSTYDVSISTLLTTGLSLKLPVGHPFATQIHVPALESSLLSFRLELLQDQQEDRAALFAPMIRQFLEHPYESRYFVNVKEAVVSLHGRAPYLPPPLQPQEEHGVSFDIWLDPTSNADVSVRLTLDSLASLGKLYMRYRTVFAAFPLLIVTLVLRKQFRVYDVSGVFISFTDSLEESLCRSIPLLITSLTLLAMSLGSANMTASALTWYRPGLMSPAGTDYHRNDLLIGTEDAFFWFLTPLIGIVSIGVCLGLHYFVLLVTRLLGILYSLTMRNHAAELRSPKRRPRAGSLVPSTSPRRMATTVALLFLVSTFIPYQFAYLVACLVQLFTVVRALRINLAVSTTMSANYYHYAHSVFLLMLWVLPINLPILAVWVRNLAVHWLTPFSSHHNVLSITPFILLVEHLATNRMVPRLRGGLRHVTSVLLFTTALCAAVYGVSHAYALHHLVNLIAAWLVIVHSTAGSWPSRIFHTPLDRVHPANQGDKTPRTLS